MTTPTPGQPLSEADVSLLQPGDWLLCEFGEDRFGVTRSAFQFSHTTIGNVVHGVDGRTCVNIGRCVFLGRPDQDGWIFNPEGWAENPVPGVTIEYRCRSGSTWALPVSLPSEALRWGNSGWSGDIIAYRPHAPVSRPGDGVEGERDSKLLDAIERVDRWANYAYTYADTIAVASPLSTFTAGDLRLILSALTPPAEPVSRPGDGVEGGWIVSNGNDDRWRAWDQGNPIWVDDPAKATRYARREDAEAVHTEDEDAWCVKPYTNSASDVGEMIRHVCDFQVDSKSGISICTEPTCRKVQRKRGRGMCPSCARGEVRHFSTDDGFWLEIECSAGGTNEHGLNGWFSTIEHYPDGSSKRREYVATDSPVHLTLTPPAEPVSRPAGEGETTQHTPRCWGRTSYSDEMAHCYCKPAGEGEREAVARQIQALLAIKNPSHPVPGLARELLQRAAALLSPAAPDAGGGDDLAGKLKAIRDKFLMPTPDKEHTDYAVMTRCIAALQPGGER